jgi:hypothetical protein
VGDGENGYSLFEGTDDIFLEGQSKVTKNFKGAASVSTKTETENLSNKSYLPGLILFLFCVCLMYQQLNNLKFIAGSKKDHFLLGLLFNTEDGVNTFLQNVGLQQILQTRRYYSSWPPL